MKISSINRSRNVLLTNQYGDILYDNLNNKRFQSKLEKVQYRAYLLITGAIKGTSRQRLYNELNLHLLAIRR